VMCVQRDVDGGGCVSVSSVRGLHKVSCVLCMGCVCLCFGCCVCLCVLCVCGYVCIVNTGMYNMHIVPIHKYT